MSKLKIIVVCAILLLILAGCQLAQEIPAQEDARLAGVFITTDFIDWPQDLQVGQVIPVRRWGRIDFSDLFPTRRIYAEFDEETREFVFPDVEGIPFFTVNTPCDRGGILDVVVAMHGGEGISTAGNHVFFGDNATRVEMEGTIYAIPGSQARSSVYFNKVFQTAGGTVFMEPGGGGFSFHGSETEGSVFAQTLTETHTTTVNGVETTNEVSITINLSAMFSPENIALLEMDNDSRMVRRTSFAPDEMPETFYLDVQTAYVILETHRPRPDDPERVVRELVERGWNNNQWISTFSARDNGILVSSPTELIWPES